MLNRQVRTALAWRLPAVVAAMGLMVIGDGLGEPGFSLPALQATMLNDRDYSADLGLADVVAMCRPHPTMSGSDGQPVDVREACDTLAANGSKPSGSRKPLRSMVRSVSGSSVRREGSAVCVSGKRCSPPPNLDVVSISARCLTMSALSRTRTWSSRARGAVPIEMTDRPADRAVDLAYPTRERDTHPPE
jgi:hypothetical protein